VRSLDLPNLSGLTLLAVDDNDDALDMLGTFLRVCGAHVLQARNGLAALAYVDERENIGAIITDLSMPAMDGVELVQRLRQRRPARHLPAIALTGFYEQYMDTAAAGFDAFLRKPVNFDELCRTIRSVIRHDRFP
jgi:two-component system CheB/CheR fusion protein